MSAQRSSRLSRRALDDAFDIAASQVADATVPFVTIGVADLHGVVRLESFGPREGSRLGVEAVCLLASATKPIVSVVNRLPLEDYLRGGGPCEMPATWPVEALRAQAIAARSYAARKLRPGVSYFDTYDDSRSQVYRGVKVERAATDAAVADTAGIALWSGDTVANAMFHSTGGGATENNENVYV